ncbi:hypothetical protein PIB30_113413, partial [Stylosanthes scabra]|nr:hypothetical protein [Stylosanthes scabra]
MCCCRSWRRLGSGMRSSCGTLSLMRRSFLHLWSASGQRPIRFTCRGTSAQPEIGPDHAAPFHADSQEHAGLDELLYQMSTCPPAEFASLASTYRMTRAGHDSGGASSSHAPPPPPPPPSYVHPAPWVPTYSSPPVIGFPVFDPS